jgi:hypothetical protein
MPIDVTMLKNRAYLDRDRFNSAKLAAVLNSLTPGERRTAKPWRATP